MVTATWSLQRADHGEQPYWAIILLAAALGQLGLPGGGFVSATGRPPVLPILHYCFAIRHWNSSRTRQGIADCLLHPGELYDFNGTRAAYPDIRLVYWAGGNPFHHHQDIKCQCADARSRYFEAYSGSEFSDHDGRDRTLCVGGPAGRRVHVAARYRGPRSEDAAPVRA